MRRKVRELLGKKVLSICLCVSLGAFTMAPVAISANTTVPKEVIPTLGDTIVTNDGKKENTRKLVWQDEFNETTLDTTKWGYQVGDGSAYGIAGWGNNELQYYTDDGNNVSFQDGKLVITAKKNTDNSKYQGASYTSGRIWSKGALNASKEGTPALFAKKYGRFEAKISMPEGTGYWPAFWMMPAYDEYGGWALSGEIDIMEARGRLSNQVDGTLHYGGSWPNNKSLGGHYTSDTFRISEEHIYALEWLPGSMKWYVDGKLFYETSDWYTKPEGSPVGYTYPAPFDQEFYLMFNLAVGGNYDGGQLDPNLNNGQMKVDYVRVYDLEGTDYDESVQPPAIVPDQLPNGVIIGSNLITGTLNAIKKITSDYANQSTNGWDLVCLTDFGGDATVQKQVDEAAKVEILTPGNQSYAVQLIHKIPLTKGYRYRVSFDAKADAPRQMETKVSNPVNFSLYSDVVSTSLTTNYTTQQMTFDMGKESSVGRLEFNLGLNNIPVYIKNVKLEVVGLIENLPENAKKLPLPNGEHIYNGTFDLGNATRMQFWNVVGTTGSVSSQERALKLNGTGSTMTDAYVEQVGLNLLKTDTYQVTFTSNASLDGTIRVELLNEDRATVYANKEFQIGTQKLPYEFSFTMGPVTDEMASLRIYVGGNAGTVTIDSVSMKRLTDHNVSYDGVKIYPVGNGDFDAGIAGWSVSQTEYKVITENGSNVCYAVGAPCANNYDKMLMYLGVDIVKGQNYTMKFKAKTSSTQTQKLILRIQREGGDWASVLDTSFEVTSEWQEYTYQFTAGISGNLGLKYLLGAFNETCDFGLKDVELYVTQKPLKQGAFLVSTQAAPKVNESMVLKYFDKANWDMATNHSFTVNALPVANNLVHIDKAAKTVTLDPSLFGRAGSYTIQATADGFDSTNVVVQSVMEASGNLIVNGSFDTGTEGFGTYFQNGCGTIDTSKGNALIRFIWHEGNTWDLQLYQENIPLNAGKAYLLEFDASATIRRPFIVELGNRSGANPLATAILEKSMTHYKFRYDAQSTEKVKLNFLLGNVEKGDLITSNQNNPHDIIIDNIVIREMTPEELAAVTPELMVAQTIKLGEDSILHHSVEQAWNEAAKVVYLNGVPVGADQVAFLADQVVLDHSLFITPGQYNIVIKAAGLDDTIEVTQIVIGADGEFIKNGTFDDFSFWGSWFMNGDQTGSLSVADGKLCVTNVAQSPELWAIQVFQDAVPVSKGIEYTLTFQAKSSVDHSIVVQCAGVPEREFSITTQPQTFRWTFTSALNGTKLNFLLATKASENNAYTLEFDQISLKRSSDIVITPEPTPEVTPSVTPEPTPEVTPSVTPEPTPEVTPSVIPEPTQVPEKKELEFYIQEGVAKVVLNLEKMESLKLPESLLYAQLKSDAIQEITLEVNTVKGEIPELILPKEMLQLAKEKEKNLSYVVRNSDGTISYEITIEAENLKKVCYLEDFLLGIHTEEISKNETVQQILGVSEETAEGVYISVQQEGALPTQSQVRLYVGDKEGVKVFAKLYLYAVNTTTGKLEPVPFGTTYSVDRYGYITLDLIKGNGYVLLPKKAQEEVITPTKELISVEEKLELNKLEKIKLEVTLPFTLESVRNFAIKASLEAKGRVIITQSSSNPQVATIDKFGVITAKGTGKVLITTTVQLYYGATYTYQTELIIQ